MPRVSQPILVIFDADEQKIEETKKFLRSCYGEQPIKAVIEQELKF